MSLIDLIASEYGQALIANNELQERAACEESLASFVAGAWKIIDPGEPLVWGYPMDAICDHVQAVDSGHITRLLITVPPGFSKSTITNVCYPAWAWLRRPQHRFICASYSEGPTVRDNNRFKRIIQSQWYQQRWAERFALTRTGETLLENDKTGWKMATSVGGELMGWRCNCMVIDDPNKPKGEESKVRASTNIWFREVVPTRLNNMERDAIILIQQRLHLEDCAGTALASNIDWVHCNIPMEYEPREYVNGYRLNSDRIETFLDDDIDHYCREVFWQDWRTEEGELAWPERFTPTWVRDYKQFIGPTMVAAQFQQQPIPRGGAIIKSDWWQMVGDNEQFPPMEFILASVDTAYTQDKSNDPSAMTIWGLNHDEYGNPRIYLLYAWQDWLQLHELVEKIIDMCQIDKREVPPPRFPVHRVLIESKANGISVAHEIDRLLRQRATFSIDLCDPRNYGGDKVARLQSVEHIFARGTVYAHDRSWSQKVIDQCASVPYTTDDHLADTVAQAIHWMRACGYAPTKEEASEAYLAERMYRPKLAALYPV